MTRQLAIAYGVVAIVFLVMDAVWLSAMANRLYRPAIGHLMQQGFSLAPAAIFYVLYVGGVVIFAVRPALQNGSAWEALGWGALLGLLAYATYDLTNQATLKDWPWHVTIADLCWGTFATAASAALAYLAAQRFAPH